MAKTAQGTFGTTVPSTRPMVARCNEQVEAPYEDGVKEARRAQAFDRGAAATAASGS